MKLKLIKSKLWKKDDVPAYFFILAVFMAMSSSNLTLTVAQSAGLSLFEYVLCALANHYYLIYGWLFFLVFVTGKEVRNHANSEIIRYGSFSRYNSVTLTAAAVRLALLIAVHILLAAIIGSFSLAPVNVFTVSEASSYYSGDFLDLLAGYQRYFGSPLAALVCAAGYLWLGSLFLYAVIFLTSQSWGSKGMLTACVLIIVSAIVGFVSPFDESPLEFLFVNNYYILHHALLLVSPASARRGAERPVDVRLAPTETKCRAAFQWQMRLALAGFCPQSLIVGCGHPRPSGGISADAERGAIPCWRWQSIWQSWGYSFWQEQPTCPAKFGGKNESNSGKMERIVSHSSPLHREGDLYRST
ncbi:MAG: hypothetical protein LUF35_02470 [Lachnospiraceae bacterium]|nr:hypothetical protein [Lachnospiraceae bacterium]MCD8103877.1 hypothetical protein [Lachnospiraceae bacterium]